MTDLLYTVEDAAHAALCEDVPVVSNALLVARSRWACAFGDQRSCFGVAGYGQSVALNNNALQKDGARAVSSAFEQFSHSRVYVPRARIGPNYVQSKFL
jgi:hypothetical protein